MLHGLEARVPFLDPVVEQSIGPGDIRGQSKAPLRALLQELLPGYRLPGVKKGLAVDTTSLIHGPLSDVLRAELSSADSVVGRTLGAEAQYTLSKRVPLAPLLGYRLSQIGLWNRHIA